jgi:hypothetical protein
LFAHFHLARSLFIHLDNQVLIESLLQHVGLRLECVGQASAAVNAPPSDGETIKPRVTAQRSEIANQSAA